MTARDRAVVAGLRELQPELLAWAARVAAARGVMLRVVHAYGVGEVVDREFGAVPTAGTPSPSEELLDAARRIIEALPSAPTTEYVMTYGPPETVLMEEARSASLLVVGVDDVSWLNRVVGGEISARSSERSACPVVVVPEAYHPWKRSGGVVAVVDAWEGRQDVVEAAAEAARLLGVGLRIELADERIAPEDAGVARAAVAAAFGALTFGLTTHVEVVRQPLRRRVVEASNQADLVVLPRQGRGLPLPGRPSVSAKLEGAAQSPLWFVPVQAAR